MLRICFLRRWFALSDPVAEDAGHPSESMGRSARIERGDDAVPDATKIPCSRQRPEVQQRAAAIFEGVRDLLTEKRLRLDTGAIVDATIIAGRTATKNATKEAQP